MVYWLTFQTAVRVMFSAGMVPNVYAVVPSLDQNWNVYPVLAGTVSGAATAVS